MALNIGAGTSQHTPTMGQTLNKATIAVIAGASTVILLLILGLVILLHREASKHKRLLAEIEHRGQYLPEQETGAPYDGPLTRPRNALRRSTFLPFGAPVGWNTLDSREDVSNAPLQYPPVKKDDMRLREKRNSSSQLSWPFTRRASKQASVQLTAVDNARLSAIIESPAILPPGSPSLRIYDSSAAFPPEFRISKEIADVQSLGADDETPTKHSNSLFAEASLCESLKPQPLSVTKKRKKKRDRAQTIATTTRPILPAADRIDSHKLKPHTHTRSFSLGSQEPGDAPYGPVPPLPLSISDARDGARPRSWVEGRTSRQSISSVESVGSSLLLASPRLQRSSSARLQAGAKREYANSLISGPRQQAKSPVISKRPQSSPEQNLHSLRGSIKSNQDSVESVDEEEDARSEDNAHCGTGELLSVRRFAPENIRLSRVSSASSIGVKSPTGFQIGTPRRQSRFLVTPNGSPAQRCRSTVLRDISGNQSVPIRQLSQTSSRASSTRSSNGNPFQWDPSPMASGKPSALKGSPGAHKGHRRQNCVRISLSPTVIGAQSKSPGLTMADIQEESPQTSSRAPAAAIGLAFPNTRDLPRPPSSSTFAPEVKLRPTTLRASLTPSSPTLSLIPFVHDPSSQEHSSSSMNPSPRGYDPKRLSTGSGFTIPTFPSPGKTILTTNVLPTPTFSFSRPSNEFDKDTSPPAEFKLLAQPYAPQSPLLKSVMKAGDQGNTQSRQEQARASGFGKEQQEEGMPVMDCLYPTPEPTPKPLFVPQAWSGNSTHNNLTPISPPCSPKSMSPSLSPRPATPQENATNTSASAKGSNTHTQPDHSTSPIPALGSRAQGTTTLLGPRDPPASPLRMSVARLRRMNSDAKEDTQNPHLRAARRYMRLGGRGVSPALEQGPARCDSWVSLSAAVGSTGTRDSMASLWEIDRALEGNVGELEAMQELDEGMEELNSEESRVDGSANRCHHQTKLGAIERHESIIERERRNTKRHASVWDDGECFWDIAKQLKKDEEANDVQPLASAINTQNKKEERVEGLPLPQRVSQMRKSAILDKLAVAVSGLGTPLQVKIQPPSNERGTPGSLYDENGFLKC